MTELADASDERRLFRDIPQVKRFLRLLSEAAPDAKALVLGGDAATQLAEIGAPFEFADARSETFAKVVETATEFGPASARARLLDLIFSEADEARGSLRALAVGDSRAIREGMRLFALSHHQARLDDLALSLISGSSEDLLVPAGIVHKLSPARINHLGIKTLDGPGLGELLRGNASRLVQPLLDDGTIAALLKSDVPSADLVLLPIFPDEAGVCRCASELWRETATWQVPSELKGIVPLLKPTGSPVARRRAEELIQPWSPDAQIGFVLSLPEPHRFADEILSALEHASSPALERLRKVAWLTDRQHRPWAPDDILDLPHEVFRAARAAFGGKDDLPFLPLSDLAPSHRDASAFAQLRAMRILPNLDGSIEGLQQLIGEVKPIAFMGQVSNSLASTLMVLAECGADLSLPGWPLLAAILRLAPRDTDEILRSFGTVKQDNVELAAAWMNAIADISGSQDQTSKAVYAEAFGLVCGWPLDVVREVMARVRVPVRNGSWRSAREVVANVDGIAPSHRLDEALERFWQEHCEDAVIGGDRKADLPDAPIALGSLIRKEAASALSLVPVLKRAVADLPPDVLALLVGVVRRTTPFREIVRQQGLAEGVIDRLWRSLRSNVDNVFTSAGPGQNLENIRQKTLVHFQLKRPSFIKVETLAGVQAELPAAAFEPLLVIGDRHLRSERIEIDGSDFACVTSLADVEGPVGPDHIRKLILTVAKQNALTIRAAVC